MEDIKKLRKRYIQGNPQDFNGEEKGRLMLSINALQTTKTIIDTEDLRILQSFIIHNEQNEEEAEQLELYKHIGIFCSYIYKDINSLYNKSQQFYYKIAFLLKQWGTAEEFHKVITDNKLDINFINNEEYQSHYFISENFKKNFLTTLKNSVKEFKETLKYIDILKLVINFWARYYKIPNLKKIIELPTQNLKNQINIINTNIETIIESIERTSLFIGEENAEQLKEFFKKELPQIKTSETTASRKDAEQIRAILKETDNFFALDTENFLYSLEQLQNIIFK